jgi:hypothetical protein
MMSGASPSTLLLEELNTIKQWTCIDCNKVFPQSKLLETHAVETDHKAYRCTKERACGKLFTLRSSWIRHERSHSAQKSHACSRCRKRFHRKDNCHDHERTCGRVSQRARVTSHLASTSPTISGTTRSVTPIDLFTPRLIGNEYEKAIPSASRGPNVPPKSSPLPSAGYYPPTDITPPGYPTTTVLERTANHPLEADHNALFLLDDDNTENHTISRNVTSQPPADSDWKHWLRFFQSQETAPPFELGSPEEHWEIETSHEPCPDNLPYGLFSLSGTRNPRRQNGHLYRQRHIGSERKPRSKITTFFTKLRAYIKAPFRRHKQ